MKFYKGIEIPDATVCLLKEDGEQIVISMVDKMEIYQQRPCQIFSKVREDNVFGIKAPKIDIGEAKNMIQYSEPVNGVPPKGRTQKQHNMIMNFNKKSKHK